jgi:hypothetical protein
MTNQTPEQFMSPLRTARMTDAQRLELRARLKAYAFSNPARSHFWSLLTRHAISVSFAMIALLAGGTIATAHYAKPDSFFYPVRTALNDRIAIAVSGDEDAQIQKELEQINRDITDEQNITEQEFTLADDELQTELNALQHELEDAISDIPTED